MQKVMEVSQLIGTLKSFKHESLTIYRTNKLAENVSFSMLVTVFSSPQNKDVKAEDHAGRELNTLKSAQTIPQSVFWVINKTEPQTGRLEWPLKKPTMEILCRNCFNIWGYIYWVNVEDADTSAGRTVSTY